MSDLDELLADEEPGAPPESMMGVWPDGDPVEFEVPGRPIPWAQMAHNPKSGGRFMPGRQAKHTALFIQRYQMEGLAPVPKHRGVVLGLTFYVKRPDGHYGSGRNSAILKDRFRDALPTGRPDLSNLIKLVEDALTTNAWEDDDQVVMLERPAKRWGKRERTVVRIWLAPPPPAESSQQGLALGRPATESWS